MQVWLPEYVPNGPLATYRASASVLDDKRLRAQANEAKVILRVASGWTLDDDGHLTPWEGKGWATVALTRAWKPYVPSLALYGRCIAEEMVTRGMSTAPTYTGARLAGWFECMRRSMPRHVTPAWLGGPVHSMLRASLLAKHPEHYGQFGWTETPCITRAWDAVADQYGKRAA